jgi:arylsulfatase A-like enzyme
MLNIRFITTGIACSLSISFFAQQHPNVILILTDDQGYGDLGVTGNPHVKTPVIDAFARQSIRFNNFYVCPVSAPTRSGLLTGRYSLRTGIRDTYNGGAIMASGEITIAEMLKQEDYKTGIFGKWHLGDNYPCRPVDQGFDESVIHLAGGMGQPGDITTYFRKDSSYFDPVLWHNGKQERYEGYCSDIFTSQAISFIEKNNNRPFFCYLAFNAPHTPLQVPDKYYRMYKGIDPSKGFAYDPRPFPEMNENDKEDARKVYAMVSNIDDNIGRLLKKIDDLGISGNTVVIFMTDNGPQQRRYVAGMRGLKGTVYNGGVRVPFYMRFPPMGKSNMDVETLTANIDVLPTIAEICHAETPNDRKIDGISMLPLISGEKTFSSERPLFFYWSRHYPELYNNMALIKGRFKIVGHTDYNSPVEKFELFELSKDPFELKNIVKEYSAVALILKTELDSIFRELVLSDNLLKPPYIEVGSPSENPVILNRNDADGERGIWDQEEVYGKWNLSVNEGFYNIRFRFIKPLPSNGRMVVETKSFINQVKNNENNISILDMNNVYLPSMKCDFIPFYESGARRIFPFWVEIEKIDR